MKLAGLARSGSQWTSTAAGRFHHSVDVPGIDPNTLELTVERNVLSIAGERPARHDANPVLCERPHARFSRQLYLGDNLDAERVHANYQNGVLTITIPVSERARPRKIDITGGDPQPIDVESTDQSER